MRNSGKLLALLLSASACAPRIPHAIQQQYTISFVRGDGKRMLYVCPADGDSFPKDCLYAPHSATPPRTWPIIQPRGRLYPKCCITESNNEGE